MPIVYLDNFYHPNLIVPGNLTIGGNLIVNGETTSLNVNTIDSKDQCITLNKGGNALTSQGAGIEIDGTNVAGQKASILWDETNQRWNATGGFAGRCPIGAVIASVEWLGEGPTEDGWTYMPEMADNRFLMGGSPGSFGGGGNYGGSTGYGSSGINYIQLNNYHLPYHNHGGSTTGGGSVSMNTDPKGIHRHNIFTAEIGQDSPFVAPKEKNTAAYRSGWNINIPGNNLGNDAGYYNTQNGRGNNEPTVAMTSIPKNAVTLLDEGNHYHTINGIPNLGIASSGYNYDGVGSYPINITPKYMTCYFYKRTE